MRLGGLMRAAAGLWPLLLGAAALASLPFILAYPRRPAPVGAVRAAAGGRPQDPVELLRQGLRLLESGDGDPLPPIRMGLAGVRGSDDLIRAGFDPAPLHAWIRRRMERETDPAVMAALAELGRQMCRVFPGDPSCQADLARLLRRAGLYWEAGGRFVSAAEGFRGDAAAARRALRDAADSYAAGGFFAQAADVFERLSRQDSADAEALYRRAESLMLAGLWDPDALAAFGEYAARVKPGDPLLPRALLARGVMLSELGRHAEALREFERIVRERGLGIDPRSEEWAEALLRRGRALNEIARDLPEPERPPVLREARQAFQEYLDRYAAAGTVGAGALEAGASVVRIRSDEGEWNAALERLDDLLARLPAGDPPDMREAAMELRFLRGELLSLLGRHEEAAAAFDAACRRHSTEPERLRGLLGRARAMLRLGRTEEARVDLERARAVYESERGRLDRLMAGRGVELWGGELDALAMEAR